MEKQEIISLLKQNHHSFITYIDNLGDKEFVFSYSQKWTAGQQLRHIYLSVRPVVLALSLPKLLVRTVFGRARRSSMDYDELVQIYHTKLERGYKATRPYIPNSITPGQKAALVDALSSKIVTLCSKVEGFAEDELDTLMLPHPLLGKLTMREMLYFTIYHVEHHHVAMRGYLTHLA
jgi:hypothetical protein